jgi:hypothetical protein
MGPQFGDTLPVYLLSGSPLLGVDGITSFSGCALTVYELSCPEQSKHQAIVAFVMPFTGSLLTSRQHNFYSKGAAS